MMVTAVIFMLFLLAISSLWISYSKWMKFFNNRLEIHNEAMISRAFIVNDLQQGVSFDALTTQQLTIDYPENKPASQVNYGFNENQLIVNYDFGQDFPAAVNVSSAVFSAYPDLVTLGSGPVTLTAVGVTLNFQKGFPVPQKNTLTVDLQEVITPTPISTPPN